MDFGACTTCCNIQAKLHLDGRCYACTERTAADRRIIEAARMWAHCYKNRAYYPERSDAASEHLARAIEAADKESDQ